MGYIKRTVENMILDAGKSFPCIAVYGPRQVGKSTTVDHLFGDSFRRVTLDDLEDKTAAKQNPRAFLEAYGWPLIIDEIQKVPELLDEIKMIIDRQRLLWLKSGEQRQLMYVLTGSNRFELQQGISESLAGRCGVIEMTSFSQAEKRGSSSAKFDPDIHYLLQREKVAGQNYRSRTAVFEDIFQGGMPDVCTGISERDLYYKSYVSTYLEKDVRNLIQAGSETQFRHFLSIVAFRTAQELHVDNIANTVGIDVRTCKKWLSILETSGIICLLQPYLASVSKRIIKSPKMYFMDTGLCAHLCGWPSAKMLEQCAMSGAFFETYVVSELMKNLYAYNVNPKETLFYYRDIDKKEIDLLYVKEHTLYPIEIKSGSSPSNPTKNFMVLGKYKMDIASGIVIDTCDKIRPINDFAYFYPVCLLGM